MKIMVVSPKNKTVFNFRGDLIKLMLAAGHEVVVTGPNQDFIEDIKALGVSQFFEIPLVKDNTGIVGDLKYLRTLTALMKREKPDMVFSYTIKPVVYGSLAARMAGVKKVFAMVTGLGRVYTGNSMKTRVLRILTSVLYKQAFCCCKRVIFQNHDDIEQFVGAGYLPREKAAHIDGSGVNMTHFHYDGALPKDETFIMVGRIICEKGVIDYCEAAHLVRQKYPDVKCLLVGFYDQSIGAIKSEEIKPYIECADIVFLGEQKDVAPILEKCRYFVLPTYYREGLPRTILEAMAMGKPIITTDWPGCRDAVQDGVNGLLVEPKNPQSLADKMCWMIEHPEEAERMGANAYRKCAEVYDVNIINKRMMQLMEMDV